MVWTFVFQRHKTRTIGNYRRFLNFLILGIRLNFTTSPREKSRQSLQSNTYYCDVPNPRWARVGTTSQALSSESRLVPISGISKGWELFSIKFPKEKNCSTRWFPAIKIARVRELFLFSPWGTARYFTTPEFALTHPYTYYFKNIDTRTVMRKL